MPGKTRLRQSHSETLGRSLLFGDDIDAP